MKGSVSYCRRFEMPYALHRVCKPRHGKRAVRWVLGSVRTEALRVQLLTDRADAGLPCLSLLQLLVQVLLQRGQKG